jgi:hypothetical protein
MTVGESQVMYEARGPNRKHEAFSVITEGCQLQLHQSRLSGENQPVPKESGNLIVESSLLPVDELC